MPGWQASTFRLEVLQHLVVWTSIGSKRVTAAHLRSWLHQLGDGAAGRMEDPVEQVFVSRVLSKSRDFLVRNGMHEAAGFCLQRFVNVLNTMPEREPFAQLRRSVYALLQLSDTVAGRADLTAHLVGEMIPLKTVPAHLVQGLPELAMRVTFSTNDLRALGIDRSDLAPFILDEHARTKIDDQRLGGSTLERFPLLRTKDGVIVALPTAVSMAIRRLIVEFCAEVGMASTLYGRFAQDLAQTLSTAPLLGGLHLPPVPFELKDGLLVGSVAGLIDEGRLLHLCFVVDDFDAYDKTSTSSAHPDSSRLGALIDASVTEVRESFDNPTLREAVTLVVICGWGRPITLRHEGVNDPRWRFEHISAADLEVISWAIKFKPLDLWRLLDARDRLRQMGVVLVNANGLLNLYAWSLELEGDLVPHDQVPGELDPRETLHVVGPMNGLIRVRKQVADGWDVHHATSWTGQRLLVRRQQSGSYFDEFLVEPSYISMDDFAAGRLVAMLETRNRTWWTTVETPNTDDRSMQYRLWRALDSWIGKAAPVLEKEFPHLPTVPLAWICRFEDSADDEPARVAPDRATARSLLRVEIHEAAIHVTAVRGFLHLFREPTNLAESLLVESLIEGSLRLAGVEYTSDRIRDLLNRIVPNEWAREVHSFEVTKFRQAVTGATRRELVLTTKHDDAFIQLGLGWQTRSRAIGTTVEGMKECCDFLNSMVEATWTQTRAALQTHNREWLLMRLLENHEAIVLSTDDWLNTARAITFLHGDPRLTEFQAAARIMELNGGVLASRLLAEMALCECPAESGTRAGDLDIARLLASALHMHRLGGWSEAIRYETKKAVITISPLGDVRTHGDFDNEIAGPYSLSLGVKKFRLSAESYDENFDLSDPPDSVEHLFDAEFWAAWLEAYGFTVDELRIFMDSLDNEGVRRQSLVFVATDSEIRALAGMEAIGNTALSKIFHALTLCPRKSWDSTPDGFSPKDWYPWRYRRRLSLISRPILRLNGGDEQRYLVAPGMIRDGVAKILDYCFRGGYEAKNFPPGRMRSWIGAAENERGHRFNKEVASRLKELGWNTRTDIKSPAATQTPPPVAT